MAAILKRLGVAVACLAATLTLIPASASAAGTLSPSVTSEVHDPSHRDITNLSVPLGTTVHDEAIVTGSSGTPTGTVDFKLYASRGCSTTPMSRQLDVRLSLGTVESAPFTPTAAGWYSYRVHYDGSATYASGFGPCEPFQIVPPPTDKVRPTVVTEVHNASHSDITGRAVNPGTVVHDKAILTGTRGTPTGTVDFRLYPRGDCTGTAIFRQFDVALSSGRAESATSAPTTPGHYSYRVFYDGSSTYQSAYGPCEPFEVRRPPAAFIIIDEDSIDNGLPPNFFSASDVNDDIAEIGERSQLRYFEANVGRTINLHTGQVGDEGWFAVKTIPSSWVSAGPTSNGLRNYVGNPTAGFPYNVGPGLGGADATGGNRETRLDKIPDVTPFRKTGLRNLIGRTVCALVYDSDISINYGPLNGNLQGANLGTVAFTVNTVTTLTGFSSSSLPEVSITIRDADTVCEGPLEPFTNVPAPTSSSTPVDI